MKVYLVMDQATFYDRDSYPLGVFSSEELAEHFVKTNYPDLIPVAKAHYGEPAYAINEFNLDELTQ